MSGPLNCGFRRLWNDPCDRAKRVGRSRAGQDGRNEPRADARSAQTTPIRPARNPKSQVNASDEFPAHRVVPRIRRARSARCLSGPMTITSPPSPTTRTRPRIRKQQFETVPASDLAISVDRYKMGTADRSSGSAARRNSRQRTSAFGEPASSSAESGTPAFDR